MESHQFESVAKRENSYFWYVGRREILREALMRNLETNIHDLNILDYGCGAGGNILVLKDFGRVTGTDISDTALQFAKTRGFQELLKVGDHLLPFQNNCFDIVSSLDVFEHIEGDMAAIRECARVLKQGGILLVTVPAHKFLWSGHDVALHHLRRYTYRELREKLERAGFKIVEGSHFVTLAVPMNLFRKLRDKLQRATRTTEMWDVEFSPFVNGVLLAVLRIEKVLMRHIAIPFGSSLVIVARKV